MDPRLVCRIVAAFGLAMAVLGVAAQGSPPTTEQLGKDPGARRQELEQQQARDREQQQRASQQQQDQQWNDTVRQQQGRAAADAAQGQAVLRSWQQRPPLAPEKNPLLGRWQSLGSSGARPAAPGVSPEMAKLAASLLGGITSGMCDSMLGRGLVEFRPSAVVAIGGDGREHAMYRAEYRGGGSRVVVLPQGGTSFTHMIIDFDGASRATVAAVGCSLTRAGGGSTAAAAATEPNAPAAAGTPTVKDWTLLGTVTAKGGMDAYIARSTIRRSGNSAQMWDLMDFKTGFHVQGKTYLSARNQYEYDCVAGRRRMLSTTGFAGHMAQGAVLASDHNGLPWEEIPTSGLLRDYWKVACTKT